MEEAKRGELPLLSSRKDNKMSAATKVINLTIPDRWNYLAKKAKKVSPTLQFMMYASCSWKNESPCVRVLKECSLGVNVDVTYFLQLR